MARIAVQTGPYFGAWCYRIRCLECGWEDFTDEGYDASQALQEEHRAECPGIPEQAQGSEDDWEEFA